MMNAEMAREMMRSRSQTPNPEPTRAGDGVRGAATASEEVEDPTSPSEPGAIEFPGMPALLYTEPAPAARRCTDELNLVPISSQACFSGTRLQYTE